MEKELEQTQMRLSVASQELNSVKASAQQAQREREQVKDYRHCGTKAESRGTKHEKRQTYT